MRQYIVKSEMQSQRFESTGIAKPSETRSFKGMGLDSAGLDVAGRVFRLVMNRTDPFLQSIPGPVANAIICYIYFSYWTFFWITWETPH